MDEQKVLKTLDFWFIHAWNNINQLQQSGSCIQMSEGWIWAGRIRAQILLEWHKCVYTHIHTRVCVYMCVCIILLLNF